MARRIVSRDYGSLNERENAHTPNQSLMASTRKPALVTHDSIASIDLACIEDIQNKPVLVDSDRSTAASPDQQEHTGTPQSSTGGDPVDGKAASASTSQVDGDPAKTKNDDKKASSLSTTKIIASAAAAITASIVTTKLAGYLNSFLIVGCSSILIAILSEVYNRTLKKVKKLSAKAVYKLPYEKVLSAPVAASLDKSLEQAMADTTTIAAVSNEQTVVAETRIDAIKAAGPSVDDSRSVYSDTIDEGDSDNGEESPSLRELQAEKGAVRGFIAWTAAVVSSFSWVTKAMIVVLGVTLLSTGVNWVMVKAMEQPSVTNVTQQITREEVQELPESEKQAIQRAAVAAAQDKADDLSRKLSSLTGTVSSLSKRLDTIEESKDSQSTDDATEAASASEVSQSEVDSLKQQVDELQAEVDSLKTGNEDKQATQGGATTNSGQEGAAQ